MWAYDGWAATTELSGAVIALLGYRALSALSERLLAVEDGDLLRALRQRVDEGLGIELAEIVHLLADADVANNAGAPGI